MSHLARKLLRSLLIGLLVVSPVVAGPVLHEKLLSDPAEDLRFGATTPSGKLPAALKTRSGVVPAPPESREPSSLVNAYGGSKTSTSFDATYHVDKLTTRPDRVQYDEPFRPSLLPFKRMYAFDLVRDDMSFSVSDKKLTLLAIGGLANDDEDTFFADFEVDLVEGIPVRIPSVGPGAIIRAMHADPPLPLEVLADGAENWFVRAERGGRARIVMQVSIRRSTFGASFAPVSWARLAPHVSQVPVHARSIAEEVLARVGADRSLSPSRALEALVRYFRGFHESSDLPTAESSLELYRELSLAQKGVCRHRAYAFSVSSLALGLPTRLVHNEAHAWVEVFDSEIWHRIDLGGAASNIQETRADPHNPHHRPPQDPHSWPVGSKTVYSTASPFGRRDSGSGRSLSGHPSGTSESQTSEDSGWPSASISTKVDSGDGSYRVSDPGAAQEVTLRIQKKRLLRGRPLAVSGTARRDGHPCSLSRIDIFIEGGAGQIGIGSLATNRRGAFQGQVTLPQSTPVGSLRVSARVAGGCE